MKFASVLCVLVVAVGCSETDPFRHLGDAAEVVDTVGNVDLTITKAGNGHGSVGSTPAGIACGASCTASFMQGTMVTLGALADDDSDFTGWSGACTGTAQTCDVTLAAAANVTATFKLKTHTVTLTKQGPGTGAIHGDAIDCTDNCTLTIDHGTTLSLSAVPSGLSVFAGWGGACSGNEGCMVTVTSDLSIDANFALDNFTLFASSSGTGTGTVTSNPAGIDCGSTCTHTFTANQMVTLTATPATGSSFTGWTGGGCSGTGTCVVTIDAAKTVSAAFTLNQYAVTVTKTGMGTVASTDTDINCGTTCTANYDYNTSVTLAAVPATGWVFTGWGGACSGNATTCTLTVDQAKDVTATFQITTHALTVSPTGTGTGTVTGNGISCGSTCSNTYDYGASVTLTAAAATGSTFMGWGGACTGTGTCIVSMTQARNVTANFDLNAYALTVTTTGSGTVTSNPTGISCGSTCTASFDYPTAVSLTAVPATGYTFTGWGGACSGTGACNVTMDAAKTVTATFTIKTYALTVSKTGNGTITSTPSGINCGSTCSGTFDHGTAVALSATAATGYTFTGWGGACTGTGACNVTMDAAKNVTATFTINTYALTVSKTGNGTVTSTPAGISCGATCNASFNYNTPVSLSAVAATGYTFTGWGGACTGTGACNVTMDAAKTVTATFTINTYMLGVSRTGSGTVTSTPTGISCGAMCAASFNYNTSVALSATAATGWTFTGWGGACSGTGACNVTMDAAKNVTATFTINTYALTVTKTGSGTVTSTPTGISCGSTCGASFDYNTSVSLNAVAATGYTFTGWGGACSGTGACNVTMDAAKTVTATFTINTYALTVSTSGNGSVTSTPAGISCGANCSASFNYNTVVALSATPATGYTFTGWGGACSGTGACSVTMDAAKTVTATFTINTYMLGVSRTGSGTVTSTPAGISCGAMCAASFNYNTPVALTATAATGWTFQGWGGACSGTGACNVTMDAAKNVTATFTINQYALSVSTSGTGVVNSTPSGISCGSLCVAAFDYNTVVSLSAGAAVGYTFTGWGGACSGTGACNVTMDASKSVTATFTANNYTLTVSKSGSGTVSSSPSGISCGANCSATFTYPQVVSLSAMADPGYTFTGWGGACSGTGACSVTMDASKTVTATFTANSYLLTVTKTGNGTVTSVPSGINCGANCSASFTYPQSVSLSATADPGYTFMGWGGACSGTGACSVTMNAAKTVTATFSINSYALTVTNGGNGVVQGGGIDCGSTCSGSYTYGTSFTLTATPNTGYHFVGWTGDCSGTGSCSITMNGTRSVGATFAINTYALVVTPAGTGAGTVTGPGIDCGLDCNEVFNYSTTPITLTASATSGSMFTGWSGDCSGTGNCTITMNQAHNVTATFAKVATITLTTAGTGFGTVSDGTISCSGTCSHTVPVGTALTLTASPDTVNQATLSEFTGWSITACGTGDCGVTVNSNMTVTATFKLRPNWMFVSSKTYNGQINGVAGADKECQTLAAANGIPGTFRAYLSWRSVYTGGITPITTTVNAPDRFAGASGWIRLDKAPVANSINQMHQGTLFNAPLYMDNGQPVTASQTVFAWTGTNAQGTYHSECYGSTQTNINPWDGIEGSAMFGNATSATTSVVQQDTFGCQFGQAHLYCFGVDRAAVAQ